MHNYSGVHCFRGSDDIDAWLHDFDVTTVYVPGLGNVHRGFYNAVGAILPACLELPRPTAITGHSLGAAMAVLYAGVLAMLGTVVPLYAFEPPRMCADDVLEGLLNRSGVPWYATRNGNDIVTDLPHLMTLPGPLTHIGKPSEPIDNMQDHNIAAVIAALEV